MNSFTDGKPLDQAQPVSKPAVVSARPKTTPRYGLFGGNGTSTSTNPRQIRARIAVASTKGIIHASAAAVRHVSVFRHGLHSNSGQIRTDLIGWVQPAG